MKLNHGRFRSLRRQLAALLAVMLLCGVVPAAVPLAAERIDAAPSAKEEPPQSWLLKWSDPAQAAALRGTLVIRRQAEAAVDVVRPAEASADVEAWLRRLRSTPGVEYVHPNGRVHALELSAAQQADDSPPAEAAAGEASALAAAAAPKAAASDPELAKQSYLKQIGALAAWKTVREQTALTIAIVDTGIDLDHPDLKKNLVPGINLIDTDMPPEDNNGHGTSVAGVIAASGNNGIGVSGILWKAKLMPIKALDHNGDGTEQDLGEAILYAVRKQAKIVVLSVGLYRYSPYMQDIVNYAESKGVLLVAAAGNDGQSLESMAVVKYPAAYSTVLAVGGVKADNSPDLRSNPGTELDLSAAWNVYTTAVGGSYKKEEGTSMAAPQVAAAAALIWARYPKLKTYQVRELLRQTTRNIGQSGFDNRTGYGLLQIDKALSTPVNADGFEPNDTRGTAALLPLNKQISAVLNTGKDIDWYTVEAPYDGKLTMKYQSLTESGAAIPPVRLLHYVNGVQKNTYTTKLASGNAEFTIKKGTQKIGVQFMNSDNGARQPYLLDSSFIMKPDAYESNDQTYEAFALSPRSQTVVGNFHQKADRDWYAITFKQSGTLRLTLEGNTARIDPGLAIQRAGQSLRTYDEESEGQAEVSPILTVTPGKYYIRVHNAISSEASPVIGQYTLKINYVPKYDDPNEPNNQYYEGLSIRSGTEYVGVIDSSTDVDWFQLRLTKASQIDLQVFNVPSGKVMQVIAYDKKQQQLFAQKTGSTGKLEVKNKRLPAGVYYFKLTANEPFDKQYYRFKVTVKNAVSGAAAMTEQQLPVSGAGGGEARRMFGMEDPALESRGEPFAKERLLVQ